ncbi:phosphonate ABC transporter ATP-binding protein [Halocynthiibacter styelae]|uniref:ATP-binding cassette domain-containing protein n=1 Tax=Halocynthiibacter styelae TaxID=2761955 RepID=A0A8J7IG01_9RHOB|nr:ATP-binding cassette domain-containing protein [Paenihalocynthiibacter styelae]MBI1495432.1 ATP-binding cassette domain-containing protein [Paenihalocynthiibacter styelae]
MNHAVALSGVSHAFADSIALRSIDLTVSEGVRIALLGPSGAGKSTLLALLDRRLSPKGGQAYILDKPLVQKEKTSRSDHADVGFIFQEFALLDRLSVYQNVMNGRLGRTKGWSSHWLSLRGRFDAQDHLIVARALADTGLSDLAHRRADQLSGGQRQRVAIARCLAQEPRLILADEPVSNLDPTRAADLLALITSRATQDKTTVIFSSHQPDLAQRFSDRVIGLRDGAILFDRPGSQVTASDVSQLYDGFPPETNLRVVGA